MKTHELTPPVLAIVVPCFNEEQIIQEAATQLKAILNRLIEKTKIALNSFIYFVDDGSTDNSWKLIQQLHQTDSNIKGLKLARNFGHQKALLSGLLQIKDKINCAITLDADLQDDINTIEELVDRHHDGFEIIYGVRKTRSTDNFLKKYTALLFYKFLQLIGVNIINNHADYRLASKRALDNLADFKEINLFLRGIFPLLGFKSTQVYYDRKKRLGGKSKYTLFRMLSFALDGITSFSIAPLRLITTLGMTFFASSLLMSAYIIFEALIRNKTIPGWASTVLPIYFIGGIQLLSIGIIGEYIGKIYQETKARPRFIIDMEVF